MSGAVADGFFGEEGLLADAAGDFGQFSFIGTNGGEIVGLADEVEGAQRFPNLVVARINDGHFSSCGDGRARRDRERSDAPADRRADFDGLLTDFGSDRRAVFFVRDRRAVDLELCDQAALMDDRATLSVSRTRPEAEARILAGCRRATI